MRIARHPPTFPAKFLALQEGPLNLTSLYGSQFSLHQMVGPGKHRFLNPNPPSNLATGLGAVGSHSGMYAIDDNSDNVDRTSADAADE